MPIFLAWFDAGDDAIPEPSLEGDLCRLHDGLYLVDSGETRSSVYHAIKRRLPPGTALLVAPLGDEPKLKGMAAGSVKWVRARKAWSARR